MGDSNEEFISALNETNIVAEYLRSRKTKILHAVISYSMGGLIAQYILTFKEFSIQWLILDSVPMYERADILYLILSHELVTLKRMTTKQNTFLIGKLANIYWIDAAVMMTDSLSKMSVRSLKNILWSCMHLNIKSIKRSNYHKIIFEFGSQDLYAKRIKKIRAMYPDAIFQIRNGYKHCNYWILENDKYQKELLKSIEA